MKQVFQASDGTTFDTAEECEYYERSAGVRQSMAKWAHSRYGDKHGQEKRALNYIKQWEADRSAVTNGTFEFVEHPPIKRKYKKDKATDEPAIAAAG